jgi:ketosteroid isomerase-like protein
MNAGQELASDEAAIRALLAERAAAFRARDARRWKVTHEHTSVPFYMDGTDRPAFDLRP